MGTGRMSVCLVFQRDLTPKSWVWGTYLGNFQDQADKSCMLVTYLGYW